MLKLFPYIKKYYLMILAAIILLFVQANVDLTLPDYLSRIVNIGIQQGGLESEIPSAMRASTFERVLLFLSPEEKEIVTAAYQLVEPTASEYAEYLEQYPLASGQALYVLQSLDQNQLDTLSPIVSRALITVSFLEQATSNPESAAAMAENLGFDISQIPAGMDLFAVLGKLPASQRDQMLSGIQDQFETLGESMIAQMGIAAVKTEYEAMGVNTDSLQTAYILRTGGWMLLLTLISVIATILVGLLSARVAAGVARDLRDSVFVRVTNFAKAEIEKFSTASLITRSTNDITQIQMVTMMIIRMVFFAPIMGIGGIIRALDKAPSMWWIIAGMVVVLIAVVAIAFTTTLPKFKIIQTLIDNLNRVVRENLSGMMVVRAFNRQDFEEKRFDKANLDLTGNMLFVSRVMVIMMPIMMFLMSSVSLLVVWVGAHQVAQAQIQVGDMMAFIQYTMQIFFAFMMMSFMFIMLPRASASAERIVAVLETEPSIVDQPQPKHFSKPFRGVVEFRDVSFHYPDAEEDVLHDISFTACPGETTAFIGTTGSGKSTIVNLIPRFFDVTDGTILIDGVDIRQVSQSELHSKIGYVPQRSNLFTGTIESNLRLGNEEAAAEELQKAIEIAQATEFINEREDGLKAEISQGGTNVSGGQRQRLAIARALVKRAPINIFDDSFSALDYKTDAALRKALRKYIMDSAVFIVSQRVATIKTADQIIVLDEGKVVGKGTHKQLMETNEVYRDIALSQLSQEELS
ncbi:MAG: ABC transporter [Chloroflexi bacterium HGW-Chloroflexi-3]|nr:MAG: ABC transporter [Chloroflexi bacterium HGW-Chloroflexi-3]